MVRDASSGAAASESNRRRLPGIGAGRIRFWEWLGDAVDARRSGKAGIPCPHRLVPTGRQSEIYRRADIRVWAIRNETEAAIHGLEISEAALAERVRALVAQTTVLEREEREILSAPSYRVPAEVHVADSIVEARRAADRKKAAAPIRAQIDALRTEREKLTIQIAAIDEDIAASWRRARSRSWAEVERARRREARWWRILCRYHPDGAELSTLFDHGRFAPHRWMTGPGTERTM